MDGLVEQYLSIISNKKRKCEENIAQLSANLRTDDANIQRVRLNIYDMFSTAVASARKMAARCETPRETFIAEYGRLIEDISLPWQDRLENAKAHGDARTVLIEENKLAVVRELSRVFASLTKEDNQ